MKKFLAKKGVFTHDLDVHVQFMAFKHEIVHVHDFFEFVYVTKGEICNKIDGEEYLLTPGTLAFVDIGQTHEMNAHDEVNYINILIKPNWCNGEVERKNITELFSFVCDESFINMFGGAVIKFEEKEKESFDSLIYSMLEEYNSQRYNFEKILNNEISAFLIIVARKLHFGERETTINSVDSKMSMILQYIEENLSNDLSLDKVANKFFYNPSYFSRMFKASVGMKFTDYIQEVRVKKALKLIYDSDYSIDRVVDEVGYVNKKQFYNIFKKKMGTTPGSYRKSVKTINPIKTIRSYNVIDEDKK